jgi:hypothetical protein
LQELAIRRDVSQEMGLKLQAGEKPGPVDIYNPKTQSAILKLVQERSPEARNRKMLDKFKDYFASKPTDPAAYGTMLQQLQQWINVPEADLKSLADARAAAMQKQLEQAAGIAAGRIVRAAPEPFTGDGREVQLKMTLATSK